MGAPRKIPTAIFDAAFSRAESCLFSAPVRLVDTLERSLAVRYNSDRRAHEVHTTFSSSFIDRLQDATGLALEDCCFLALAHESGHVELNQRCVDKGLDPADSEAQLEVLGFKLSRFESALGAECHKESAIEAFCDAKLAGAAFAHFPRQYADILQAVAEIRAADSNKPHRFGDGYYTLPIFAEMLNSGKIIDGQSAAKLAYDASKLSMPPLENAWLSIKRPAFEKLRAWRDSREAASPGHRSPKP